MPAGKRRKSREHEHPNGAKRINPVWQSIHRVHDEFHGRVDHREEQNASVRTYDNDSEKA